MSRPLDIPPEIVRFIEASPWRWVKSTPEPGGMEPHQYVIRHWREVDTPTFWKFVDLIRERGHRGRYTPPYNNRPQTNYYFEHAEFVYWHIWPIQLCRTKIEYRQHQRLDDKPALNQHKRVGVESPANSGISRDEANEGRFRQMALDLEGGDES